MLIFVDIGTSVVEILTIFFIFQDGCRRYFSFSHSGNFIGWLGPDVQGTSPNFM